MIRCVVFHNISHFSYRARARFKRLLRLAVITHPSWKMKVVRGRGAGDYLSHALQKLWIYLVQGTAGHEPILNPLDSSWVFLQVKCAESWIAARGRREPSCPTHFPRESGGAQNLSTKCVQIAVSSTVLQSQTPTTLLSLFSVASSIMQLPVRIHHCAQSEILQALQVSRLICGPSGSVLTGYY